MSLDGYDVIEIAMDSYDEPSDATVAQDGLIGEATDTSALNPPATPGPDATENMVDGVVIVQELGPADAPVVGEAAIATEFLSTVSPREPSPCADDEPAYSSNSWSEEDERDLKESIEAVVEAVSRRVSEVLLSAPAFIPATISIQAPDEPLGGYPSSDSD